MKNKKQKWTDDESAIIVLHYEKFGRSNPDHLATYFPHRSKASVSLELDKYHHFKNDGCFELVVKRKYFNHRPGTVKKYTNLIKQVL